MNKEEFHSISQWVEYLQINGRITFSLKEVLQEFSFVKELSLQRSLTRLSSKGKIASVWNGFYVIIPIHYRAMGILPAVMYIDYLMKFLGRDYYVGLLNAATFYGASHQAPMDFTVITTPPSLRGNHRNGIKLNFINRTFLPSHLTREFKTEMGYVQVSSAELTAIDIVQYEKEIGGMSRVATVLNELMEVVDFSKLDKGYFNKVPTPVIQRLGYLLENILDNKASANILMQMSIDSDRTFRKVALRLGNKTKGYNIDNRWKIIINTKIELD